MLVFTNLMIGIAILGTVLLFFALWYGFFGHDSAPRMRHEPSALTAIGIFGIVLGLALLPFIHMLVLLRVRPMATHTTRDLIVPVALLMMAAIFLLAMIICGEAGAPGHVRAFVACFFIALIVMIGMRMNAFLAFSIPSTWITIIPIFISYFVVYAILLMAFTVNLFHGLFWISDIGEMAVPVLYMTSLIFFFFIFMAGTLFPAHRRMTNLWQPRSLPKIKSRADGFTLIELLIVVAIVAIISSAVVTVTSRARAFSENQEMSRESLALAEDEIAVLRASPSPLKPGIYQVDPRVAELHPQLAQLALVEISETSGPLVQARVTVGLKNRWAAKDLSVATLIAPRKEARP